MKSGRDSLHLLKLAGCREVNGAPLSNTNMRRIWNLEGRFGCRKLWLLEMKETKKYCAADF
jgi:hypothetical protein